MTRKSIQAFSFFSLLGIILAVVYLWGKVQIDFAVRKNAKMKKVCQSLQHDIDDLQVELNTMRSYQRITELAKEQGLVFLPSNRVEDFPVDLSGLKPDRFENDADAVLAGMAFFQFRTKKHVDSLYPGGADGTR